MKITRYLLSTTRARVKVIAILSAAIAYLIGCGFGAWVDAVSTTKHVRSAIAATHDEWYHFTTRLSTFVHAEGVATDQWLHGDYQWHDSNSKPMDLLADIQFGFPFKSHSYTVMYRGNNTIIVIGSTGLRFHDRILPLNIKVGWLANSVILFLIATILDMICAGCIYKLRIANGLCPHCKYDTKGLLDTCPECGRPIADTDLPPKS